MRRTRLWAVSTEKTATAKSGEYDPSELVMVLAHPREAIRDLTRLREDIQKESNAVIIIELDVSGSMSTDKKYIARSMAFWLTEFLKKIYDKI